MKIVIGALTVVVVMACIILSLPFFIDLNKYQDHYKPLIEDALNRKVQLQGIRLTMWPRIGARVDGLTVLDDPAFGSSSFTSLSSLDVGVKLMPLLGGKVEVENITLRAPTITIIKNKNGVLNVSTIGRTGVELPTVPSRAPIPSAEGPLKILALLAVDRVSFVGGTVIYRDLSAAKPAEYVLQDLELLLQSVRLGQTPSLHVSTLVQPFNLPVTLDGAFGPLNQTRDIDAMNFQLALGKSAFTITGSIAGHNAKININSPVINTANVPMVLPLKKPVEVKRVEITAAVNGQEANVSHLSFQLFDGQVTAQGSLTSGSDSPLFTGKGTIQGLQLGPALDALATTHVSISGTAGADLAFQGRGFSTPDLTKTLKGIGHIVVRDGKIERVNILEEALSILKVAGISLDDANATIFSTFETDLAVKDGIIDVQRLLIDSQDFQATGKGTIGFDQTLRLTVTVNLSQALSEKIIGQSPVTRLMRSEGRLSVPLLIGGTVQAPSYGIDSNALTGKVQGQVKEKMKGVIDDLLKGSTKPDDLKQKGRDLMENLLRR